ncbi:MAG: hypothetical protein JJU40_03200, partial [Rhodobacteraceae bacterium]|nr:hypothetical protein [Paracoccaceae bacterium]
MTASFRPDFALDLGHAGITLLSRAANGGWVEVGTVDLDDPALGESLASLRATAARLGGKGFGVKLVIPNSQILYLDIEAPGPDEDSRRAQIAHALDGRTPYGVGDLVFDWSGEGPVVQVAVVARETLAEAEEFAANHRLAPVCFVARPESGTFAGEPFLGLTRAAERRGITGIERDAAPVEVSDSSAAPPPAELLTRGANGGARAAPTGAGGNLAQPDPAPGKAATGPEPDTGGAAVATSSGDASAAPSPVTEGQSADGPAPAFSSRRTAQNGPADGDAPPAGNDQDGARGDGSELATRRARFSVTAAPSATGTPAAPALAPPPPATSDSAGRKVVSVARSAQAGPASNAPGTRVPRPAGAGPAPRLPTSRPRPESVASEQAQDGA